MDSFMRLPKIVSFSNFPGHRLLLLVSIFMVATPHFIRMPLWLSALCLAVIGWRIMTDVKLTRPVPRWIRIGITLAGSIGVFLSYQTLLGRYAGSALLVLMLCLKLLELNKPKDTYQTLFLCYFIVAVGFLFNQSIWMGLYMATVVMVITVTLVSYSHLTVEKQSLTFDRVKLYVGLSIKMMLHALPLAMLMFVLFPRLPGPLWSLPEDAYSGHTGLSDKMAPGNISNLTNSEEIAFRVKFDGYVPDTAKMYWRGPVFSFYDGRGWSTPEKDKHEARNIRFEDTAEPVSYTVTMEPHDQRWLLALDLPALLPVNAFTTSQLQLLAEKPVNEIRRYKLKSFLSYKIEKDNQPADKYLALPEHSAPRAREMVQEWRKRYPQPLAFIAHALDYYKQEPFYYTRRPPRLFGDPVDEFLFDTRRGYCEHFASSFTVLMRISGIPARVVTGYQGGESNPFSDYFLVRQASAHAWVEVWLKGIGWKRVDPTNMIPLSRIENDDDAMRIQPAGALAGGARQLAWLNNVGKQFGYLWDSANNGWNQWVVGFNDKRQHQFLESVGLGKLSGTDLALALMLIVGIGVAISALVTLRIKRTRISAVNKSYQLFCRKLAKRGLTRHTNEGARDYAKRIIKTYPELDDKVSLITHDYYALRYAQDSSKENLTRLMHNVRVFKV